VRPIARWRLARDWTLLADPRALWYPQDRDNPDIDRYRGHADLHLALTQADGWKIALLGRIGSTGDYGSLLTEVSYPLQLHAFDCTRTQHRHWTDAYIYAQAFIGYGRTLLDYDIRAPDPACALGIAFVR
jgi:outer membrane phospholipase A